MASQPTGTPGKGVGGSSTSAATNMLVASAPESERAAAGGSGGLPKPILREDIELTAEQQALADKFRKVEEDRFEQRQKQIAKARETLAVDDNASVTRVLFS